MSILQDIYNATYHPPEPIEEIPCEIYRKRQEFFEEVKDALGRDFVEKHLENLYEVENCRDYINFREGFRLGVLLLMEVL